MRSLQSRLGVGLTISLLLIFVVQWLVVSASLRHLTESYVQSRLILDIESLLAVLAFDENGSAILNQDRVNPIFHRPFSGHYYRIMAEQNVVRSRSLWDQDLDVPTIPVGDVQIHRPVGPQNQSLIMLIGGYRKKGKNVVIAVAEDYSSIEADFLTFQWRYVSISAVVCITLIILQTLVVRRGLRPLERVRRDIRRMEYGEIRQIATDAPLEVSPLVNEINRLAALMGQRLERSRKALGNLAHALKTPLTVIHHLLGSDTLAQHSQVQRQLSAQSDQIGYLIQRELKRARVAGPASPGQRFVVQKELEPLAATLKQIYADKQLELDYEIPPNVEFSADREDMLELLGNLLDNACKWAKHHVRLKVETGNGITFSVEDDGPGAEQDQVDLLTERGVRIDESVTGHGLGLAIVQDIVNDYDGKIRFGRSQSLGGFFVSVSIPYRSEYSGSS